MRDHEPPVRAIDTAILGLCVFTALVLAVIFLF